MGTDIEKQMRGRRGVVELLRRVRSGELRPSGLSLHERRTCVAYLELEGYTQEEMSEIFQVSRQTISRDLKANREEASHLVDDIDVRSVAGGLIGWSRHLCAKAIKEKDYALAWKIHRELMADLQSLGYLPKAAERHELQVASIADLMRLALDESPQAEIEEKRAEVVEVPPRDIPELPAPEEESDKDCGQ